MVLYLSLCACTPVCKCTVGGQWLTSVFLNYFCTDFLHRVLYRAWSSLIWSHWLASKPQGSSCFSSQDWGYRQCCSACICYVMLRPNSGLYRNNFLDWTFFPVPSLYLDSSQLQGVLVWYQMFLKLCHRNECWGLATSSWPSSGFQNHISFSLR